MAYELIITEHAEELLDSIVSYLLFELDNKQAATHFFDEIEKIYERIRENPLQFPVCRDLYLASKQYREAVIPRMNYILVYSIQGQEVVILGVFYQLEAYQDKMNILYS